MVSSEEEIARRLAETDAARSARRTQAATTVGELAVRHTQLARQLAELERELGKILIESGEVIELDELARITDIPADELTRWRDQAVKPIRGVRRKRQNPKKTPGSAAEPPTARPAPVGPGTAGAVGTASS